MENKTIAVIGDIHGCLKELEALYDKIKEHTDEVYTVGDLIDRGPDSKGVIQFCIDNNIKSVMGNHEDMLLKVIQKPRFELVRGYETNLMHWLWNGGRATIKSYTGSSNTSFRKFSEIFRECGHLDFISNLPLKIELDNCIITHGGMTNGEPIENVLWNRRIPSKLDKIQVIGHTPNRKIIHVPNHFINVDTGGVFWGKLSGAIISKIKEISIFSSKLTTVS